MTHSDPDRGHLLRNMVRFGRLLRAIGIKVTPTQIFELVGALDHVDIRHREDVKNTARTILISRHEHLALFDRAFDLFWQARKKGALLEIDLGALLQKLEKKEKLEEVPAPKDNGRDVPERESPEPIIEKVFTYSGREVLRQKDFVDLTPDELQEVKWLMQSMQWQLEQRRTRRKTPSSRGTYLDMRRTFRQNLRYGGEPLQLTWRQRKLKRRPLVVICDISGSMERYSRILLRFIYAISNGLENVEAFVFSTRLTRITRQLRERDIDVALDQVTRQIRDWGGGTRIGDALKTFNYKWGRRVLGQGALVLIISDGWDRGDIDLLRQEISRLQLSCQRLIWLNPLLGSENYEPLTRGMQTALPFIDDFLPVHNLSSLEQLGNLLKRLGEHKPSRRQHIAV
jgi:uncharacterized protein with von Willebrand factor type A (vWA) domain